MAGWRVGWGGGRVVAQARTSQERLQNPPAPNSQFPRYCKLKPTEVGSAWSGESCLRHHPVRARHRKVSGTPGCLVCGHAELFQPFPVGLRKDLGCTVSGKAGARTSPEAVQSHAGTRVAGLWGPWAEGQGQLLLIPSRHSIQPRHCQEELKGPHFK